MKKRRNQAGAIETTLLFERVREFIRRFVVLGQHEAIAVTLWVMMTLVFEMFDCVPYLMISSAEKGCGKTLLLEVLELIVKRPWLTGRTTPAVLARKIHDERPTLLLDESDATFRGDKEFAEALRGILNSGYRRSGKYSVCVARGNAYEYRDFNTFGPKAIAGIGALPDTVADRSIPIQLMRRLSSESVDRFRRKRVEPEARALFEELEAWASSFRETVHDEPDGLDSLPDRAADICEPLLTIAEAGGEELVSDALTALRSLCGHQREDESQGVLALAAIKAVFEAGGCDRISSTELAAKLAANEELPFARWREFRAADLAKILKPFKIRPHSIRLEDGRTPKGYYLHDFADVFGRFLPPPEKPPQPQQAPQEADPSPPQDAKPSPEKACEISDVADVADVALSRNGSRAPAQSTDDDLFEYAESVGLLQEWRP